MAKVYVSLGSNIDRSRNIRFAIKRLQAEYAPLLTSSVYESDPVGFQGDRFFNLVVGFDTHDSPAAVFRTLRSIEHQCDRTRGGIRFSDRTLDLDLLLYDALVIREQGITLPREEILTCAFVLAPLAEIAGEHRHPVQRHTFARLWSEFDKTGQPIWTVPFDPVEAGEP
uniref:2-amino-4-hydroxy-6-hydroxymethyldihydropteridine diphosphokinase n=1 Tax=Candidatus Kentrum sp. FM TaxID=2126340 RepID=A0A450S9B3_9GAMM|nr:MAG: 2-amino-4-hydroxy-6-hydroxymethyldihydropteridinediphosphokinase [Candidatus Kentron sp. FM]VFJ48948.1 MAG: 2-amino-4-hydroxy-6-hydroxymethyldihydropteridinediphosphokinase [Candidatus Kentron sp. FM]VFK13894.1 MAG: 2-amino-4-hydroxy-6-hydroxymethyldihydropteridinediphosphokinase [Candidatus Kentron sp. FM]